MRRHRGLGCGKRQTSVAGGRVWGHHQAALSSDGSLLAGSRLYVASDGITVNEVRLWDVTSCKTVKVLDRCQAFDFSPDGRALAVLSRTRCVVYAIGDWTKETQVKPL